MKLLVCFSIYISAISSGFSQLAVVSCDRNNILIAGVNNPLSIAVENTSNNSIVVKANKGTVTKIANGRYVYNGHQPGEDEILIFRKDKGKLKEVRRVLFRVESLPDPVAYVGNSKGGKISKNFLIAMGGVIANLENTDFQANVKVESYTVCLVYKDSCKPKSLSNSGNRFNEQVLQAFQGLRINDTVVVKDIDVIMPDGRKRRLLPLVFTIVE